MPPFGFGMSMPNLRRVAAAPAPPPAPVTVVQENWVGSGAVSNKVPSPISGGGVWVANNAMNYAASRARPNGQSNVSAFHSITYTNAKITGVAYPGLTGSSNQPAFLYARGDINTSSPSNCYFVSCNESPQEIVLLKRVAGSNTQLGVLSGETTSGVSVGLEVIGSAVKVYYNGTLGISVTDTSIASAGYWGFGVTYGVIGEDTGDSGMGPITIAA